MTTQLSYSEARAHLAELMDRAEEDQETFIITRHGKPSTVLISAEEWESMEAVLHLLRSPRNAARLFEAMAQIERGEGVEVTMEELRRQVGLDGQGSGHPGAHLPGGSRVLDQDRRRVALRVMKLTDTMLRDPFEGEGKPEPLKHLGPGHWSRRITGEHRLVYEVSGDEIHFLQGRYHY